MNTIPYIGRFAPTPSGPLHLGSLVAALGSFLDARAHSGRWLLRVEDVDSSRSRADYIAAQMHSLHCHGLHHDGTVRVQSAHLTDYLAALDRLRPQLYPCECSRKHWHEGARMGALGSIYPGTCREKTLTSLTPTDAAIRLRLPDTTVTFHDRLLGDCRFSLTDDIGDPVLRRRDGDIAYALAVVVDDALQGVTDIVRGQDLVAATAIHLTLQNLLDLPRPRYLLAALHHLGEDCTDYTSTLPVPILLEEAVRRWSR